MLEIILLRFLSVRSYYIYMLKFLCALFSLRTIDFQAQISNNQRSKLCATDKNNKFEIKRSSKAMINSNNLNSIYEHIYK